MHPYSNQCKQSMKFTNHPTEAFRHGSFLLNCAFYLREHTAVTANAITATSKSKSVPLRARGAQRVPGS